MATLLRAAVVAQVPDLADLAGLVVEAQVLDLAVLPEVVVDPAVLAVEARLLDLLSRQSFSAAMARTTAQRTAPYDLVPKSR